MASMERTAYPRFKRTPTAQELADVYTPTPQEVGFAHAAAKGSSSILGFIALMKSFQRLGYFPRPDLIPPAVVGLALNNIE